MNVHLQQRIAVLAWLLTAGVFVLEWKLPEGANVGLLYVLVLLLGLWTPGPWDVLSVAALATGFSVVVYADSATAWDPSVTMWNRAIQMVVVWVTAFGVNLHRRTLLQRERAEQQAQEARIKLREQESLARLGQMATIVAHEVRNPMAGIRAAAQVIGRRLEPGSREQTIAADIVARVDALSAKLTSLIEFARTTGSPDDWWDKTIRKLT